MSDIEAKALTIAREKIREVGWTNYQRKHNPKNGMCVLEGIEYAVFEVEVGDKSTSFYTNLQKLFRDANGIQVSVISWNDDKTNKKTKREIIKAFNVAIDYAKR